VNRRQLVVLGGALVSVLFLWLALRGQNWAEIASAFQRADYRWLLPAAFLILLDYGFRSWRWRVILHPAAGRRVPLSTLFPVLLLGFAANNVLPARAGEVWRMWGLYSRTGIRKALALSSLIIERVFDGFTLLFLLALAGLSQPLDGQARFIENIFTLLFGIVFVGLLFLVFFEAWTLRLASRLMWPIPAGVRGRLLNILERFVQGLHALRRPAELAAIIGSSLLAWGSQTLSFAAILLAFGLGLSPAELFATSILMLALINLGIMIPAGPGNVGTFEAAGLLALRVANVAVRPEEALAIVLVAHMLQWLLVTGLGVIIAAREGITLATLNTTPELETE
jgi:uncharacterized protein (TIRG00374 family)